MLRNLKIALLLIALLFSVATQAQKNWTYGFMPSFVAGAIKPVASDSFNGRASFSFSTFAEHYGANWNQSFGIGTYQNRFINDNTNDIDVYQSIGLNLDFIKKFSEESKTTLRFGVQPNYIISHRVKGIDGTKGSGVSNIPAESDFKFDIALKAGLALQMSPGIDLQINYVEFVSSRQANNSIGPMGDILQIGLEFRLNEIKPKREDESQIQEQINNLHDGFAVFVLPFSDLKKQFKNDIDLKVEYEQLLNEVLDSHYNFSQFFVIADTSLATFLNGGRSSFIAESGELFHDDRIEEPYFIIRMGSAFLTDNSSEKRGLFLYDSQMDFVDFEAFTPYRSLQSGWTDEEALRTMTKALNTKLHLLYERLKYTEVTSP